MTSSYVEAVTARGAPLRLRPYQVEALDAIEAAACRGVRRQLLQLPTGTGKTIVFAELVRRRGGRALVLAHRDELIEQAVHKLRLVDPAAEIGVVKAERDEREHRIVVASVQTLARPERLTRLPPDFDLVVVDEAHHAPADSYRRVLSHFGAFGPAAPLTLGVTATAERADGTTLGDVFEEIVYESDVLSMIERGYLVDLRAIRIRIAADLDRVHTRGGDLAAGELDAVLRDADAPGHAVRAHNEHACDRKALLFTPSVAMAHEMASAFCDAGVAEDYARRLGARVLVDRDARWRGQAATSRQLQALRKWRVAARGGLTRGEAADLLTAAIARTG